MSSTSAEVLFIVLLILANGLFAMAEIAIVSARKARLQQWANEGNARARLALELANNSNRFLATIQIGITLVGILAGAFAGVTLAERLAAYLAGFPRLVAYAQPLALALVVVAITYVSLVLRELVPKRVALSNRERIATWVAAPMRAVSVLAAPVVWLLSVSTEGVARLLGLRSSLELPVTEEEIKILIEQGTQAGVFEVAEQDLVASVLRLDQQRVSALMTPRPDIVWLEADDSPEAIKHKLSQAGYSRFPVSEGTLDQILGVVQAKELLQQYLAGQPVDLRALGRAPIFVPESMPVLKVLETFRQAGTHLALVVDEYGGVQGLVTLNDVLEAMVGEMPLLEERAEPQAVQREDGSWLLDGGLAVDDFKELFDLTLLPGEERGLYQTLAGFVMTQLRRIPAPGDSFEWGELHFEIVDMDGHRVDKVLVVPEPLDSPRAEE